MGCGSSTPTQTRITAAVVPSHDTHVKHDTTTHDTLMPPEKQGKRVSFSNRDKIVSFDEVRCTRRCHVMFVMFISMSCHVMLLDVSHVWPRRDMT